MLYNKKLFVYEKPAGDSVAGAVVWCGLCIAGKQPTHTKQYVCWTLNRGQDMAQLKVALRLLAQRFAQEKQREHKATTKASASGRALLRALRKGAVVPKRNPLVF